MLIPLNCRVPEIQTNDETGVLGKVAPIGTCIYEPVGKWYEAYCQRRHRKQTLSNSSLDSSSSEEEEDDLEEEEENEEVLLALDPKEWKNQDHYTVLGLGKRRHEATDEHIKRAYKRKVLRHHPDKRRARGVPVKEGDDDYFTCITRAYEVLGNPTKRRSYDSVDEHFDDSIPSISADSKENFVSVFHPVFERNKRWSIKKKVPGLGDLNSSFDEVNNFYGFWYEFDSWREYSYLDEEEKEKGENREERRWIERQNKAVRQKRKKEEVARMRQLVDNAYACDPRIAKFKEDEKAKKLAVKQAKKDAARARIEEEEKKRQAILDEERRIKEKEEEEAKAAAAIAKKEKEVQKKAMRKERKTLRTVAKDYEYFGTDDAERLKNMEEVDRLAEILSITSLQTLNESLTSGDRAVAQEAFLKHVKEMNDKMEEEKRQLLEAAHRPGAKSEGSKGPRGAAWGEEEMQALIKGVNIFPAGTASRWEVIANFLEQHVSGSKRTAKEVLFKAKELQKNDLCLKEDANKNAYNKFAKDTQPASTVDKAEVSQRYDSVATQQVAETGTNPAPWSTDEQKLLEQALKTFPASVADRWDKISECLPTRSKKDCMKRYKELVEMIRAKKAAQAAATAKAKK